METWGEVKKGITILSQEKKDLIEKIASLDAEGKYEEATSILKELGIEKEFANIRMLPDSR